MFDIVYCGHNVYEQDNLSIRRLNGSGDYFLVLFLTPFYIHSYKGLERKTIAAEPNTCILFSPKEPHHYQAAHTFKNSFVHFTASDDIIAKYNIPLDTIIYPKRHEAINHILRNIVVETINKPLHYERLIDCLVEQVLILVSREAYSADSYIPNLRLYSEFQKIRMALINNCEADWPIEKLCRLANMEKSQFYNCYSTFFKSTPIADLISARIEKAKYLLSNNDLQISQVAEMCGFTAVSHFARSFRRHCGCTPREYARSI